MLYHLHALVAESNEATQEVQVSFLVAVVYLASASAVEAEAETRVQSVWEGGNDTQIAMSFTEFSDIHKEQAFTSAAEVVQRSSLSCSILIL
ncbi:hypothetical protein Nepgr_015434 [Nepenthes gracilis]|uniref:Uncharacterized protein n=1 Tax=Nepenthes gracilis TaxID=150966 RepID=A0AAD3SL26_NEPGR|nr:hypothetical protein Nepgr_015434 [Nepenthes gracilis]